MNLYTVVFYTDENGTPTGVIIDGDVADPQADVLGRAMRKAEELRKAGYRHVTYATENSNMVGQYGVAVVGPDYDWKKRRI